MSKLLINRWFQMAILFSLLFVAVKYSDSEARWRVQIQNLNFDYYNILKPYEAKGHAIVVDIDEKSLAHPSLGQWPWSRDKLAALVLDLKEMGAGAIAFDMVFSEEDRTSPRKLLSLLDENESSLDDIRDKLEHLPDNDQVFADAIKEAGNVVTGFTFTNEVSRKSPRYVANINIDTNEDATKNLDSHTGVTTNIKKISRDAAGNGSFFVSSDSDGVIRRVPMLLVHEKHDGDIKSLYPSLSLESVRVLKQQKDYTLAMVTNVAEKYKDDKTDSWVEGVRIGRNRTPVPTTVKGEFLVYFAKYNQEEWYVSALDVLNGSVDPKKIKDKIVIIGTSAAGLKDIRSTPLDAFRPGVEIHLNIVDQILEKKFLYRSVEARGIEILAVLLSGLVVIVLTPFVGTVFLLATVVSGIVAALYAGWHAFAEYGYLLDVLYPIISVLILYILSSLFTYIRTESERKHVRDAFGHYISPEFMEELTKNPEKLKLGGDTRELTVMFTDIRNFTSISETMTPEALIHLMNDFLTPMSNLVMDNRGTIDKYMGDAMMAFWNAPLDDESHARHACQAALKMNKALVPINEELTRRAKENGTASVFLEAGIGINTGQASVGNMGSKQRFAYSALGDTVNLASRLEGQTKQYGVRVLVGEKTRQAVPEFAMLELDLIRVKGKQEPERIFVLLGDAEMAGGDYFKSWEQTHNGMLAAYRAMDWDKAKSLADECQNISGDGMTGFYSMFMDRIEGMKKEPPPQGWDGVYIATSK